MNGIMKKLENMGYQFQLAVDYIGPDQPPPEAGVLLAKLSQERDTIIKDMAGRLIANEYGLYELPQDVPLPAVFEIQNLALQIIYEAQGGQSWEKAMQWAAVIYQTETLL